MLLINTIDYFTAISLYKLYYYYMFMDYTYIQRQRWFDD